MSDDSELDRAQTLFRRFHGRGAKAGEIVAIDAPTRKIFALEVGLFETIGYRAKGDRQNYFHEFEGAKPRVFVSPDGRQIYVVGGSYTFTDRGFIK